MDDPTAAQPIELAFRLLSGDFALLTADRQGAAGDLNRLWEALDDNVVLHAISGLPELAGDFHGRNGFAQYTQLVLSKLKPIESTIQSIDNDHNFLVALTRSRVAGPSGEADVTLCTVGRVQNGRIMETWQFSSSLNNAHELRAVLGLVGTAQD